MSRLGDLVGARRRPCPSARGRSAGSRAGPPPRRGRRSARSAGSLAVHHHADLARELRRLLEGGGVAQLHAAARLVEQVDGLVGQEAVGDVAAGLVDRGLQRLVAVGDVVELLVAVLDPAQDLDRLLLGGRGDLHRLEAPLQRAVLLDVLAVLGGGGGADALDLAAGERRLQDVGGVERALGRARAHQRVQLVDEDDDVVALGELPHDRLQPLLELPAVLGAGHDQRDVEGQDALLGQVDRHVALHDLVGQALDERRLAHARLADEHGVVAGAAAEDLDDAGQLLVAARPAGRARRGRRPRSGRGRTRRAAASPWSCRRSPSRSGAGRCPRARR